MALLLWQLSRRKRAETHNEKCVFQRAEKRSLVVDDDDDDATERAYSLSQRLKRTQMLEMNDTYVHLTYD